MSPLTTLLVVAAIVAILLWFLQRGRTSPREAATLLEAGGVLVDVRSAEEFSRNRLRGAQHWPLPACMAGALNIDRETTIVLYCASGARSAIAARALRRHGWRHVYDLGSLQRWPTRIETAPVTSPA